MNRKMQKICAALLIIFLISLFNVCYGPTSSPWDGTTWDVTAPDILQPIGNHYKELYDLRKGVGVRMNKEHQDMAASSAGGWHTWGSAVCYTGTSDPCNRPDNSTSLDSTVIESHAIDWGRLWIDDNYDPPVLRRWNGTNFTEMVAAHLQHATAVELVLESTEALGTTDGTGDSKISSVGYKAAAGDCDLGYIKFSHDGTGADQKGAIDFVVNTGAQDNAPTGQVLELGSDLLATFSGALTVTGMIDAKSQVEIDGAVIAYSTMAIDSTLDVNGIATLGDGSLLATSAAPTTDAMIANKKYVDDQEGTGTGYADADGTTVFNTTMTAANTFQDLDLSSYVGSNFAIVHLEISTNNTGVFVAKPKGYGSATFTNHYNTTGHDYGGSSFHPQTSSQYCYMTIGTDSSGVIQIAAANNTTTYTIKLVGYIK